MASIIPIFVALLAIGVPVSNGKGPYCDTVPCEDNKINADCYPDELSSSCPPNTELIKLLAYDPVRVELILLMNTLRNNVAGGITPGKDDEPLPIAAKTCYIGWDFDLVRLAIITLKQCELFGDQCRNTPSYTLAGQNNYTEILDKTDHAVNLMIVMKNAVATWTAQKVVVNKNDVMAFRGNGQNFSQLIVDRNIKMGCAFRASPYGVSQTQYTFLCNFAVAARIGCPIYTIGSKTCDTQAVKQFPYLCSVNETYTSSCPNPLSCDIEANKTCLDGKTHTTCLKYTDTRCLLVDIVDTSLAVETLNNARAINTPSNLPNMEWEETLEKLAAGYAVSCPTSEAECAKTPAYSYFLQKYFLSPPYLGSEPVNFNDALRESFMHWADSLKKSFVGKEKEKTVYVGCGISMTADRKVIVVCNFAMKP